MILNALKNLIALNILSRSNYEKAIKEYKPSDDKKKFTLEVDAEFFTVIKLLAFLKGDTFTNILNDILRNFADRNKDIFDKVKTINTDIYDKIQW